MLSLTRSFLEINDLSVPVDLAYPYKKVTSDQTRFFFEGEVLILDPEETSPFENYVTAPLLPCLFGRIYDPTSKKSLVFHKYAIHSMESLKPFFYDKFAPTRPELCEVSLYSCALSLGQFEHHQKFYGKKSQSQEMATVRNSLEADFQIPRNNIEMFFFRGLQTLPPLGQFEGTALTVGVTREGQVFHTSLVAEDVFNLEEAKLPSKMRKFEKFSKLVPERKEELVMGLTTQVLCPTVRAHFVVNPEIIERSGYGDLAFFSSEELNIPASSLRRFFNVNFTNGKPHYKNPFKN